MTAKPHSLRCRIRWVRRSLRRRHDTLAPCIRERIVLAALVLLLLLYLSCLEWTWKRSWRSGILNIHL